MKFTVGENVYIVKFRYSKRNVRARWNTYCGIKVIPNDPAMTVFTYDGDANCDRRESFVKARGRKHALINTMAINGNITFPKSIRTEIWKQYFDTTHELTK